MSKCRQMHRCLRMSNVFSNIENRSCISSSSRSICVGMCGGGMHLWFIRCLHCEWDCHGSKLGKVWDAGLTESQCSQPPDPPASPSPLHLLRKAARLDCRSSCKRALRLEEIGTSWSTATSVARQMTKCICPRMLRQGIARCSSMAFTQKSKDRLVCLLGPKVGVTPCVSVSWNKGTFPTDRNGHGKWYSGKFAFSII